MTLKDKVRSAVGMAVAARPGIPSPGNKNPTEPLKLSIGLSLGEIDSLEHTLPAPLPADVRELLQSTRGYANGPIELSLDGIEGGFGLDEVFPCPHAIAHDGAGNFWVVDMLPHSSGWSPIYYACHDPPVIVYQSDSLEHFIDEWLRLATPPHASALRDVHEDIVHRIWREHPGAVPAASVRDAADPELRAFAASLPDGSSVIDLRSAATGDGFAWGRYGLRTKLFRHGEAPLFAYAPEPKPAFSWRKLFGG